MEFDGVFFKFILTPCISPWQTIICDYTYFIVHNYRYVYFVMSKLFTLSK